MDDCELRFFDVGTPHRMVLEDMGAIQWSIDKSRIR